MGKFPQSSPGLRYSATSREVLSIKVEKDIQGKKLLNILDPNDKISTIKLAQYEADYPLKDL